MAAALALCSSALAADPAPRSREVDALIREADAAVKRLDVNRARDLWAQVYALKPLTMALCQLGQLDLRLGRLEEAAAELSKCVEQMPAPTNAVERRRYEVRQADLAAVRQRVAEIHLLAPPDAARLLLNGKEVKAGSPIYVAPGQHEVTVTGRHGQVARTLVKVAAGESRNISLSFESPPGAAAPRARPPARVTAAPARIAQAPARSGPKPWIVGTGAAVSTALLVTGIGLHLAANASDNEAVARVAQVGDEQLLPSSPEFRQVYDEATAANTRANLLHGFGSGALIAGAVAGAATLIYVVLPHDTEIRARAAGAEVTIAW
ncbi:tetratricopeptide repeat protein [Sorangium sp. So ce362]|uniref:tetratricopeptide repeat protein n=1 Tax=Sorangium sp. So ce362 TaxID=3133303 RepID=UPI003F619659